MKQRVKKLTWVKADSKYKNMWIGHLPEGFVTYYINQLSNSKYFYINRIPIYTTDFENLKKLDLEKAMLIAQKDFEDLIATCLE